MNRAACLLGTILMLVAGACGAPAPSAPGPAAPAPACLNPSAAHRAYVVVTHLDGRTVQKCVGFAGPQVTGEVLMRESGIETRAMQMSWGRQMCQVDYEPVDQSTCAPNRKPWWALYVWSNGWQPAQTALADTILTDGQGLGWRYVAADPLPPPTPAVWRRPR